MTQPKRLIVIGAGVVGLTSAYALAEAGHEVTVLEAADQAAAGASYANAGLVSAASAEAWSSPGSIRAAARWLFRADAPLKVHLGWDFERLGWLARFAWQARSYEATTRALTELSLASRQPTLDMAASAGAQFDLAQHGVLDLYPSMRDRAEAQRLITWMAEQGLERHLMDGEALACLEPTLPKTYPLAIHTPSDVTGDCAKFCAALAAALPGLGGDVRFSCPVERVSVSGQEPRVHLKGGEVVTTDRLVIANGLGASALSKPLGDQLSLYGVKGYALTVDLAKEVQQAAAPRHGVLDHGAKIAVSRLGKRLRGAGTAEIGAKDLGLDPQRLKPLHAWIDRSLPALAEAPRTPWAGFRPMRAQILPLLMASKASPHILYNVGHGHLGWTMAAGSALQLRDLI